MKRIFAKIHLWISVPFGLFIAVIALTGATLVFEPEITRALNPRLYKSEESVGKNPLPPSQLVARIREQTPDTLRLVSLQISGNPRETCMAAFQGSGRQTLSVDPYTGKVNGWTKSPAFFQTVRKLHRWLMDPPASRGEKSVGKVLVGISTLLLTVILISGLVIWIPRNRKGLKHRFKVSCTNGWPRFWHDTHVALGFYATIFLLAMALTGLTWSFGWYRTAAYSLFGGETRQETPAPAANAARSIARGETAQHHGERRPDAGEPKSDAATRSGRDGKHREKESAASRKNNRSAETPAPAFDYACWDCALAALRIQYPHFKTITLSEKEIQIAPDPNSYMRKTDTATFDPADGSILAISRYEDLPKAQRLRGWFYAFHTGTWGGMTTRILYFLAALIGATLPLTGYYLWIRRIRHGSFRKPK